MNDLRTAFRQLFRHPTSAAAAVLSLALGIGGTTVVFSVVDQLLLRTLPVRNPEQLVLLRTVEGAGGRMSRGGENNGFPDPASGRFSSTSFSLLMFERLRVPGGALSDLFAFAPFSQVNVAVDGVPEVAASAQFVSGNYHGGLGVQAAIGRTLVSGDDLAQAPSVAVISYRFWQRRFALDPAVVGRTIRVNRVSTEIVGVTARGFDGAMQIGESPDLSVPLAQHLRFQPDRSGRVRPDYWWIRVMGRLAPGATHADARASLEPVFRASAREGWLAGRSSAGAAEPTPDDPTLVIDAGAQGEGDMRRRLKRPLQILMALIALVLAAACANVANLQLARGIGRRREVALRQVLGAGRRRIILHLLAEALLLALFGGALGVVAASAARDALIALEPFGPAVALDLPLDARVLSFTFGLTLLTTGAFGLLPALQTTRSDLASHIQTGGRALVGPHRSALASALMVVQIALSLVLLVSTGLFARTLTNLRTTAAGFDHKGLLLFRLDATSAGYTAAEAADVQARVLQRLERIPGVHSATFSSVAVLSGVRQNKRVTVPGHSPAPGVSNIVNTNGVAPNFFTAMRLPIVLGRPFTAADDHGAPRVAVVSQGFVRDFFGGQSPIGQHITVGAAATDRVEVVGVSADAKYTVMRGEMPPVIYFPAFQRLDGNANFALRIESSQQVGAVAAAMGSIVRDIAPELPVMNLRTQEEQLDRLHAPELLFAQVSAAFGVMVMVLASVGLYGLLSHLVLQRTGEIGLRMAVGAQRGQVVMMVLRESATLVLVGIAAGAAAAGWATRAVASMLFGVQAHDPLSYAGAVIVLASAALIASLVPALRASRVDPLTALRGD